jgi:hypothetical protein
MRQRSLKGKGSRNIDELPAQRLWPESEIDNVGIEVDIADPDHLDLAVLPAIGSTVGPELLY